MPYRFALAITLAVGATGMAGCTTGPLAITGSNTPVYSTDLAGKARTCEASTVKVVDGQTVDATITTSGGGWCGLMVNHDDKPYTGLLMREAKEGRVYIHPVGDFTRIDYIPLSTAKGADEFTVRLLPGDGTVQVKTQIEPAGKS